MPEPDAGTKIREIVEGMTPYEFEVTNTEAINIAAEIDALDAKALAFKEANIDMLQKKLEMNRAKLLSMQAERDYLKANFFMTVKVGQPEDWKKLNNSNSSFERKADGKIIIAKDLSSTEDKDEDDDPSDGAPEIITINGVDIKLPPVVSSMPKELKDKLIKDIKEHVGTHGVEAIKKLNRD